MDEGWVALALIFGGLLLLLAGMLYYIVNGTRGLAVDGRIAWGLSIAGIALFFAGGSIWRRGVPRK